MPTASLTVAEYSVDEVRALSDADLMDAQRGTAQTRRQVDAMAALLASEVAYRSRRELGYEGLAQKSGARTPEALVQQLTGATARESQTMVRVGELIGGSTPLALVGVAVLNGTVTLGAAEAIRAGLGALDPDVPVDLVTEAAQELLTQAGTLTVERLAGRARDAAAAIDDERVADREQKLRDARYLRLMPQPDGMTRLTGMLDPESAAIVVAAFDAATSPRRGGPRFVDPTEAARADALVRDPRTTEQIGLDAFVELIRLGDAIDPAAVLGKREPAVQVLVTERDLARGVGVAALAGQTSPIGIETAQRHTCQAGVVPVMFDTDGQIVNVGREQRLFTRRQRIGIAARDGGCRFMGCPRPPSWCEAHHIEEWKKHRGRTDVADGVLLCRHHHLLVHNNNWKVTRQGAEYSFVPPRSLDPSQRPIVAPANSPIASRLLARQTS
ncbi:MAG: HNH endonuclease [Actinomycetota bacterium]|nr:HNH endonuclease [Actinomycetota bacterium]